VLVAPILPGLSDDPSQLDAVVRACVEADARSITPVLLHLRPGVREHYLTSLAEHRPDLLARHSSLYSRGAYAPKEARQRVSTIVRNAVTRYRGRSERVGLGARFDHD
jgi:DNA repair photolyase